MKTSALRPLPFAFLLLAALSARPATFTTDTLISFNDTNYDGADVIVTNCTLTLDGAHSFASLQVLSNGVVTHWPAADGFLYDVFNVTNELHTLTSTNTVPLGNANILDTTVVVHDAGTLIYTNGADYLLAEDQAGALTLQRTGTSTIPDGGTVGVDYQVSNAIPTRVDLSVSGDVWVAPGGAINVDGRGYNFGFGNGAGQSGGAPLQGGGGGYGGYGGMSASNAPGGAAFGYYNAPLDKGGCGGTSYAGYGAPGGGAIKISAQGAIRVDGRISADGLSATNARAGGGAGGSIFLTAQNLAGIGYISARGGAGEPTLGGGGGGGRIAFYFMGNAYAGALLAGGGQGPVYGGAGTIYTRKIGVSAGEVRIDNNFHMGTNTLVSPIVEPLAIYLGSGGGLALLSSQTIGHLDVGSNGWVTFFPGSILTVNGDVFVQDGGAITADGKGFPAMAGPGGGRVVSMGGLVSACGASYGGVGAPCLLTNSVTANAYGSFTSPVDQGSGGGIPGSYGTGGAGGGVIRLNVSGMLGLFGGAISANGLPGTGQDSSGGSGGSIWLNVGTLAGGLGTISANGGAGQNLGGGGGGGRIAIYYQQNAYAGLIQARGAGSDTNFGGPGSIYLRDTTLGTGSVLFDNGGNRGLGNFPYSTTDPVSLTLQGGAMVAAYTSRTLSNLFVGSNSWLLTSNYSLTISGSATVLAGGGISASGAGFAAAQGPGAGRSIYYYPPGGSGTTVGGGGGHGGFGGASSAGTQGGGISYDLNIPSVQFGSGGGNGSDYPVNQGGVGGGFVRLAVSNTLALYGSITADGLAPVSRDGGGGAGGSLWLTVGTLVGNGSISANGGPGNARGGGGGGGRVAIYYTSNFFTGPISALGAPGFQPGGPGSVFSQAAASSAGQLVLNNGGLPGLTAGNFSSLASVDLTLVGGAIASTFAPTLRSLFIGSNSWLVLSNNSATFQVLNNATIQAGGGISADGAGLPAGSGSGAGRSYISGTIYSGGGAGFGGYGGAGAFSQAAGGNFYGTALSPGPSPGSGGGSAGTTNYGGSGGGSVNLNVTGQLQVDGLISANGYPGTGLNSGGGSGGGINLVVGTFVGAGELSANGGPGALPYGGGGGGGRIKVTCNTSNGFAGTLTSHGGSGYSRGGAGTLVTQSPFGPSPLQLIVDNGGILGTNTPLLDSATFDINVRNGGCLFLMNQYCSIHNLLVSSNAVLGAGTETLSISGVATIEAGGALAADGTGSGPGSGPGGGTGSYNGFKGGGGYGGAGGANTGITSLPRGRPYGILDHPASAGSGGASSSGSSFPPMGGAGGGALHVQMPAGTLVLNGRLSANGGNGDVNSGGGSGGSVWLEVGTLTGAGTITANGGSGNGLGGGGGGGRIAVFYRTNRLAGPILALGGVGVVPGGAGTIYLRNLAQSYAEAVVDNAGVGGSYSSLGQWGTPAFNATVQNGAVLSIVSSQVLHNLLVASNATVVFTNSSPALPQSGDLTMTGDLTVQAGGSLNADGGGYAGGTGPGAGGSRVSSFGQTGGGGANVGYGAASSVGAPGGNATYPAYAGSGGGAGLSSFAGGSGGGNLLLYVTGRVQNDGRISADGLAGPFPGAGGGSGGNIVLNAGTLAGTGVISVNGGSGNGFGGGGGGGHLQLSVASNVFAGTITAYGGGTNWGGAGSIHFLPLNGPGQTVVFDNANHAGTNSTIPLTAPCDLTLRNGAVFSVPNGELTLSNLLIASGGGLTVPPTQTGLNLVVYRDAQIDGAGAILADGLGFPAGAGPGAGLSTNGVGSGAGYGGPGGASSLAAGGPPYGSEFQPVDLGSGGGFGFFTTAPGAQGGGVLRLSVGGTLTVNGRVSASGQAALQDNGGGASGGSIWVTADTLAGNPNGAFLADGGPGDLFQGGGGAGGRIALFFRTNSYVGWKSVAGGAGFSAGASGSVYLSTNLQQPAIVACAPAGVITNGFAYIDLFFNEPVYGDFVTPGNLTLLTPARSVASDQIHTSPVGASAWRLNFPMQTEVGNYTLVIGPNIYDLFGNVMSQVYTGAFTVSLPLLQGRITDTNGAPISGVLVQPYPGSSAVTDADGRYALGAPPNTGFTVSPSAPNLLFVPGTRAYSNLTGPLTNQDYLAVGSLAPDVTGGFDGTNLVMTWYGIPGVTYVLYASTDLVNWAASTTSVLGTGGPLQLALPIDAVPARFFRLQANN